MNFLAWAELIAQMMPMIGHVVTALHPDNTTEAAKIQTGTMLLTAMTGAVHQAVTHGTVPPVAPPAQ